MLEFTLPTAKSVLAAALLTIAPWMAPSNAHAQTNNGSDAVSTTVSYADLDLSSPHGQSTLKTRIAMAVTKVCGSTAGNIELAQRIEIIKCRSKASHDAYAAAKLNQPVLASR